MHVRKGAVLLKISPSFLAFGTEIDFGLLNKCISAGGFRSQSEALVLIIKEIIN